MWPQILSINQLGAFGLLCWFAVCSLFILSQSCTSKNKYNSWSWTKFHRLLVDCLLEGVRSCHAYALLNLAVESSQHTCTRNIEYIGPVIGYFIYKTERESERKCNSFQEEKLSRNSELSAIWKKIPVSNIRSIVVTTVERLKKVNINVSSVT